MINGKQFCQRKANVKYIGDHTWLEINEKE